MDNQNQNDNRQAPPGGNPYGNPGGNPYGNPGGNPYSNPYANPYGMSGYPLRYVELKRIARQALTGRYGTMIGISLLLAFFSVVISYLFSFIGSQLYMMCAVTFETDSQVLQYGLSLVLNFIGSLLSCLFTVGSARAYIQLLYGQPVQLTTLFYGFKNHPDRIMLTNVPLLLITLILMIPSTVYTNIYLDYMTEYIDTLSNLSASANPALSMPPMEPSMLLWALASMASSIAMLFIVLPFALTDYLLVEMEETSPKNVLRTSFAMMKGRNLRYLGLTLSFLGWILLGVITCGIALLWVMPYMEATLAAFYLDTKRIYSQRQNSETKPL